MDVRTLARELTRQLAADVADGGAGRAGVTEDVAQRLRATAAGLTALRRLTTSPTDLTARAAVDYRVAAMLADDPDFADRVRDWLAAAGPAEPDQERRTTPAWTWARRPTSQDGDGGPRTDLIPQGFDDSGGSADMSPQSQAPARVLQARLEPTDPERAELITLAVAVGSTGVGIRFDDRSVFADGEDLVVLDVVASSDGLDVLDGGPRRLHVPATGASLNVARFDILPPAGRMEGLIRVYLYELGNFVAGMEVVLRRDAGQWKLIKVEELGRPLRAAPVLRPRQLSLVIRRGIGDDYSVTAFGAIRADITLRVSPAQLTTIIRQSRTALRAVVSVPDFQDHVTISDAVAQPALRRLAEAGLLLYRELFVQRGAKDAIAFGEDLRTAAQRETLKIQVVSDDAFVPWGMLYLGDDLDSIDAGSFLGFRHIVEHLLLQNTPGTGIELPTSPTLSVAWAVDEDIDEDLDVKTVAEQGHFWDAAVAAHDDGRLALTRYRTADQVHAALFAAGAAEQLWCFYCHAETSDVSASYLQFSDQTRLTLNQLKVGSLAPLEASPLVLLNACGSAAGRPQFYDGFLPYFLRRGARGMIGTECDVPAVFAAEWGRRFLVTFLRGGVTAGQVLLQLRKEFLEQDRNPLGLLYALYCDADTTVAPGLPTDRWDSSAPGRKGAPSG